MRTTRRILSRWGVGAEVFFTALTAIQPAVGQPTGTALTSLLKTVKSVQCPLSDPKRDSLPCQATSSDGRYIASLTIGEAGAPLLRVREASGGWSARATTRDINGFVWSPQSPVLFFTVSSIYGKPGLYKWIMPSRKPQRILGPRTRTKAYPDGADYFELVGISERGDRLFVLYSPDVDEQDFLQFRNPDHLYSIGTDGSGFRRVRSKE